MYTYLTARGPQGERASHSRGPGARQAGAGRDLPGLVRAPAAGAPHARRGRPAAARRRHGRPGRVPPGLRSALRGAWRQLLPGRPVDLRRVVPGVERLSGGGHPWWRSGRRPLCGGRAIRSPFEDVGELEPRHLPHAGGGVRGCAGPVPRAAAASARGSGARWGRAGGGRWRDRRGRGRGAAVAAARGSLIGRGV